MLSRKAGLHLSKTLRFLWTLDFVYVFWLSQPSHAGLSAASFLGEHHSETCHLPASHTGLPLSLPLIGSGQFTLCSDTNGVRLQHYVDRKRISGRRGIKPFENPGFILIYKDICSCLPSCSSARLCYSITCCVLKFMVRSMKG